MFLANDNIETLAYTLEQFSFECRKVIGFTLSTLRDWLKKLAPIFYPKPIVTHSHVFSRALGQLPVITSSFDWIVCVLCDWLE